MNKKTYITPLPEAIDGNLWEVISTDFGGCSPKHHKMMIPTGETDADKFVRLHEMAHAKFTPAVDPGKLAAKYGLNVETMQVAEDARIHALLRLNDFERGGCCNAENVRNNIKYKLTLPNPEREIARMLLGSMYTSDHDLFVNEIKRARGNVRRAVMQAEKKEKLLNALTYVIGKFQGQVAPIIWEFMDEARNSAKPLRSRRKKMRFDNFTTNVARKFDEVFPEFPENFSDDEMKKLLNDARKREAMDRADGDKWGNMRGPVCPKLEEKSVNRKLSFIRKATDCGAVPINMHRYATDAAVFSSRRSVQGGTVLLDASGSMGIDVDDIKQFLKAAPHGTVAMYSGRGTEGALAIIGHAGKVISSKNLHKLREGMGGGNVVDGPALRWLAKRKGKKAWVSDGHVTGAGDVQTAAMIRESMLICKKAGIPRLDDIPEAIKAFGKT